MPFDATPFDPRTTFGPEVAAGYDDELLGDEEAAVARLSELAGPARPSNWPSAPAGSRYRSRRPGCASTGSTCLRRCSTGCGRSPAAKSLRHVSVYGR